MVGRVRLVVVAATGGVGRQLVAQAVAAGHEVTAVVRDPARFDVPDVQAVPVDLADPDGPAVVDRLADALRGAGAVLSALGPRGRGEYGVASRGTRALIAAMTATGVRRVVVISVAGVGFVPLPGRPRPPRRDPGMGFLTRTVLSPLARRRLGPHYADVALMEELLRGSGLDWTAVGVPLLTDGPATGRWRTAYGQSVRRGYRISRADAAAAMLRALDDPRTVGASLAVAR
jgi:putative NADH-flavin reductase